MPALMAISERAFAGYFGRYHADSRIPRSTATRIYSEWLRSAFAGWADWILVAEFDNKIVGHSVWRKILERQDANSRGVASCDLLVVDPEFQGRRLGAALVRDGMEISRDFAQYLVTPLHVCNYSVQRTFQNPVENCRRQAFLSQMAPGLTCKVTLLDCWVVERPISYNAFHRRWWKRAASQDHSEPSSCQNW